MTWKPGDPRFVVRELEGWRIDQRKPRMGTLTMQHHPMLSVAVLDSAYCFEMVARFNQESYAGRTRAWAREHVRTLAGDLAAQLEAEHA